METIEVSSLEHYLSLIEILSEVDIFRGVASSKYKLIPYAGRFGIAEKDVQVQFERAMLDNFKRKAPLFLDILPASEMEWLVLAQHHGLPTRLMDWTFNPLVALFFAIENENNDDCVVYRKFPNQILSAKSVSNNDEPFEIKNELAIVPSINHIRYQNQNGVLTIHPYPSTEYLDNVITSYIIRSNIKNKIRWKLRKVGINKQLMFSSLDSMCYDVMQMTKEKYGPYFTDLMN